MNERIAGNDRIETAIELSKKQFKKADTVLIVRHDIYPDSLTSTVLAKQLNAPILLTPSNELDNRVAKEIKRLGVKNVVIVGGENSVSKKVEKTLELYDEDVKRVSGRDRYETSSKVAEEVLKLSKAKRAVIASGETFPDALAVAPFAAREGYPILLVKKNNVSKEVKKVLDEKIEKTHIVGGKATIEGALKEIFPGIQERIWGRDRYETAVKVAISKFQSKKDVYLTSGEVFADALVLGPVAALKDETILLSNRAKTPEKLVKYFEYYEIKNVTPVGGPKYLPEKMFEDLSK